MSNSFARDHCKIAMAKILQTIGWHTINSTPLEVLTDLLVTHLKQICQLTNEYATEFGNTEPNLDHLGLAFREMGINIAELDEYVTYVNFCPPAQPAPKFPIAKENNLNFLKPGSQEVVTRPVHIHEHMPPMFPLLETESEIKVEEKEIVKEEIVNDTPTLSVPQFKKPADVSPEFRRLKREDEGGRPTREISSVMMTTSGFLSPAREGKLPEAKAPLPPAPVEPPPPPPPAPAPLPTPPVAPPLEQPPIVKKKSEKREKKINKELFKAMTEEKAVKKNASMKDVVKMKQKAAAAAAAVNAALNPNLPSQLPLPFFQPPRLSEIKVSPVLPQKMGRDNPDKALAAAKAKTEKFNTTITPIPIKSNQNSLMSSMSIQQVEKLYNEPDRQKINILRKISSVKEIKKKESRAGTPNMIIDESTDIVNKINLSSDITIEPIPNRRSPHYFDDCSPPGTPSTPRTPEIMLHQSPPLQKEKKKRKENKNKVKRPRKSQHHPIFTQSELVDIIVNRPKTPEPHLNHMRPQMPPHMGLPHMPFPFLPNFGGPGLIPSHLNPMFSFPHLGGLPNFGKNPYFPPGIPNLPPQMEAIPATPPKSKEPKELPPVEIKPVEIIPQPPPQQPQQQQPPPPQQQPPQQQQQQPIQVPETSSSTSIVPPKTPTPMDITPKKIKEHKKEKKDKDKIKKKNKKDKVKEKGEKKKLKEPKKEGKEKVKREKKIKKKDKAEKEEKVLENPAIPKILLKVNSPSPRPETPEANRKLNIKPIVKKDDDIIIEDKKRDPSPGGLAKFSPLVTGPPKTKTASPLPPVEKQVIEEPLAPAPAPAPRTPGRPRLHPLKPKVTPKPKKIEQQAFKKIDDQGNEVWICPSCGQQDDGRPMIGCDGCDAWYHWVCVGIQVPPDENENWYCKPCLARKNEDLQSDKKRKRKRKEKKEH